MAEVVEAVEDEVVAEAVAEEIKYTLLMSSNSMMNSSSIRMIHMKMGRISYNTL